MADTDSTDHNATAPEGVDPAADTLTCTACDRRYPVADGIPVLLISEAAGGPGRGEAGPGDRGSR